MELPNLSEPALRLSAFLGVLAVMTAAEAVWPRRARSFTRWRRWPANLLMVVLGAAIVRAMAIFSLPLVAVAMALWAARHGVGLFNLLEWPTGVEVALSLLLLDLVIWGQHAAFHRVPLFWRMHRMHHADRDIDASTALRFHPLEIAASMLIKALAVLVLGAPLAAVIAFEIVLNAMAVFNHANLRLPPRLDHVLRRLVVTPDMHRVHHSVHPGEHNRNFGFNLSIWDRLFRTYAAAPRDGHRDMRIGLLPYQTDAPTGLWWNLLLPLAPIDGVSRGPDLHGSRDGHAP